MTATELIHSALEQATPFVPRAKVVSIDRFANETIRRMAAGAPAAFDCIVIDAPGPTECALARIRGEQPRATRYTVRLGDIQTHFTDLTAAKLFAQAVLMAKEQAA